MLETIGWTLICMWLVWGDYVGCMDLKRRFDAGEFANLHPVAKVFAYSYAAKFLVEDLLFNLTIGTLIFMRPPWEKGTGMVWLMTTRLNLYLNKHAPSSLEYRAASFFCRRLLNPFDPSGEHCSDKRKP